MFYVLCGSKNITHVDYDLVNKIRRETGSKKSILQKIKIIFNIIHVIKSLHAV